jgi:hypothetical protein
MKIHQWTFNDGYGLAITAGEEPYHDGSGSAYCHSSIWIPAMEYRREQVHIAITPKRREAVVENGRTTLACIGVEIMAGVPVLHVVVAGDIPERQVNYIQPRPGRQEGMPGDGPCRPGEYYSL